MSKEQLIMQLRESQLFAECPRCRGEFRLGDALLFDGLGEFPEEAMVIQQRLQEELKGREKDLGKREVMADAGAEQRALSVGFGKILEKIAPAHRDFMVPLGDCRPLFEPIDLIAFNGLGEGSVNSITFYEIKTGKARMNTHERMVKQTVEDHRVKYRVMR
jgi:predicted Holliday junction resolvase-like endonuclease